MAVGVAGSQSEGQEEEEESEELRERPGSNETDSGDWEVWRDGKVWQKEVFSQMITGGRSEEIWVVKGLTLIEERVRKNEVERVCMSFNIWLSKSIVPRDKVFWSR